MKLNLGVETIQLRFDSGGDPLLRCVERGIAVSGPLPVANVGAEDFLQQQTTPVRAVIHPATDAAGIERVDAEAQEAR